MSGTSVDGIDAAWVQTDGADHIIYGPTQSLDFPEPVRQTILDARGWGPAADAEALVHEWHGTRLVELFTPMDVVGFHGQTVAHDPAGGRTRQLGDGDKMAAIWQAPVVWDFRSDDMKAGGQGAPLAPFFHFHALRAAKVSGRVAVLNLGGVGNVTWADLDATSPEASGALLAFDTGPASALIDDLMQRETGTPFDRDGAMAATGSIQADAVSAVLELPFFESRPPKSLDRDAFDFNLSGPLEDQVATLTAITAATVAAAEAHFPAPVDRWLVTGGGRHNAAMMAMIAERVSAPVAPIEAVGLDGDMLEAQAFAWLAVRVLKGLPTSAPGTTGCTHPVCGGKIAYPKRD